MKSVRQTVKKRGIKGVMKGAWGMKGGRVKENHKYFTHIMCDCSTWEFNEHVRLISVGFSQRFSSVFTSYMVYIINEVLCS